MRLFRLKIRTNNGLIEMSYYETKVVRCYYFYWNNKSCYFEWNIFDGSIEWAYNRIFENECLDKIQKLRRKTLISSPSTPSITQEPSYHRIITWSDKNTVIEVLDSAKMEKEILPFYFRHQKFESFVRQLNLYGFKKLKSADRQRFTHHLLQAGSR